MKMKRKNYENNMGEYETTNPRTLLQIMEVKERKRKLARISRRE